MILNRMMNFWERTRTSNIIGSIIVIIFFFTMGVMELREIISLKKTSAKILDISNCFMSQGQYNCILNISYNVDNINYTNKIIRGINSVENSTINVHYDKSNPQLLFSAPSPLWLTMLYIIFGFIMLYELLKIL